MLHQHSSQGNLHPRYHARDDCRGNSIIIIECIDDNYLVIWLLAWRGFSRNALMLHTRVLLASYINLLNSDLFLEATNISGNALHRDSFSHLYSRPDYLSCHPMKVNITALAWEEYERC